MNAPPLILASASPRRRELLASLSVPFRVMPADLDESLPPGIEREQAVCFLAQRKAAAVAALAPEAVVLGADTLVLLDGVLLGKPADRRQARAFLAALRGRTHQVLTGLYLAGAGHGEGVVATTVTMRRYARAEVDSWITRGEAFDKAGAYAIQDPLFRPAASHDGCYCNVLGLPLWDVWRLLSKSQTEPLPRWPDLERAPCRTCPRAPAGVR